MIKDPQLKNIFVERIVKGYTVYTTGLDNVTSIEVFKSSNGNFFAQIKKEFDDKVQYTHVFKPDEVIFYETMDDDSNQYILTDDELENVDDLESYDV